MENKFLICAYLTDTLRETLEFNDSLHTLFFEPAELREDREDHVIARSLDDREIEINVHADSGIALIRDVLRALEVIE